MPAHSQSSCPPILQVSPVLRWVVRKKRTARVPRAVRRQHPRIAVRGPQTCALSANRGAARRLPCALFMKIQTVSVIGLGILLLAGCPEDPAPFEAGSG